MWGQPPGPVPASYRAGVQGTRSGGKRLLCSVLVCRDSLEEKVEQGTP